MSTGKVLVLGGTGPAGICLLRELVYRNHQAIVYCRNPSKVPPELAASPLLEIHTGPLSPPSALAPLLTPLLARTTKIISLLGPNSLSLRSPTFFPDFYTSLFTLLGSSEESKVTSIYAMGTFSIRRPETDRFSFVRSFWVAVVWIVANVAWKNILGVGEVFEASDGGNDGDGETVVVAAGGNGNESEEQRDGEGGQIKTKNNNKKVAWTIFRIGGLPGGSSEDEWKRDREGKVYTGGIGQPGWTGKIRRGELARWLVDVGVEERNSDGEVLWEGRMPAVSSLGRV